MRKVAVETMSTDDDSTHCFRVADGLRAHVYHLGCNRSDPATILSTQMLHGEFYYSNDDEFYNANALMLLVESMCVVKLVAGERKKKRKIPDNFLTPLFCQEVPFDQPVSSDHLHSILPGFPGKIGHVSRPIPSRKLSI